MGFLDNLKSAIKATSEAADEIIERQRAEQAAAGNAQGQARPQTQPQARPQQPRQSNLPEGVIMVNLNNMEPLDLGINSNGQNVSVNIRGAILAKPVGQTTLDANGQREEVIRIVRETLQRDLTPQVDNMGDLKYLLRSANSLNKIVCEALMAQGFEAAMKIPLMFQPN